MRGITVDLERQVVVRPNGEEIPFEIDPLRRHLLLNGLDDIGQTLQHAPAIDAYEAQATRRNPGCRRPPPERRIAWPPTRSCWSCRATASGRR